MKRYYNKGEGFNFDEDDDDKNGDDIIDLDSNEVMDAMKLDLVESHLNQKLLDQAHDIAKKNWLWIFRTPTYKVKTVEKIYKKLIKLLTDN